MDKSTDSTSDNETKATECNNRRKNGSEEEEANEGGSDTDDKNNPGSSCSTARHKLKKLKKCADRKDTDGSPNEEPTTETKADDENTERESNNDKKESQSVHDDPFFKSLIPRENPAYPLVLRKIKPKCTFSVVRETMHRQIGQSEHFQRRFYGSLRTVERLQFLHSLKEHQGCVNTVEFNENGDLLASGSDDLVVCVWNWATGKRKSYESGHRDNIFQASWLPHDDATTMVTCAHDGQVRLLDLVQGTTRLLASHQGACNRFATHPDTPHVVISVGDDGIVLSVDVRDDETTKLIKLKNRDMAIKLYGIHSNPRNSHEFCIGGHSESVRIFDRRKVSAPVFEMCPRKLIGNDRVHITAVTYNYNGTEILASYNDDDIYLFDTLVPHPAGDYAHKYEGHRNCRTIKGVSYFGPNSEFIVSGSDCGNIFFWEKESEAIVQCVRGIAEGVVNCVKPHPTIPVLASSGLDDDIKIWLPSAIGPPPMTELTQCVVSNLGERAARVPHCNNFEENTSFLIRLHQFCQDRRIVPSLHETMANSLQTSYSYDVDEDDDYASSENNYGEYDYASSENNYREYDYEYSDESNYYGYDPTNDYDNWDASNHSID